MFRKYEKTFRIRIPQFNVSGKHFLSKKEVKRILGAEVTIEEKLDGANVGIIRHKKGFHLQKRGSLVGQSEHEQFGYFHNWSNNQNYDKIMNIPKGYIVYAELVYIVHHIYYNNLPDYFIVTEVWDGKKYLNRYKKETFCNNYGFYICPLIAQGHFNIDELFDWMPSESEFGDRAEGMIVKRYRKNEHMRGKIVWPNFMKEIDNGEHWVRKPIKINKLRETSWENLLII